MEADGMRILLMETVESAMVQVDAVGVTEKEVTETEVFYGVS